MAAQVTNGAAIAFYGVAPRFHSCNLQNNVGGVLDTRGEVA